ncbi:mammalian ependymin-related protein 1 isoform X2 [Pantherophis guttatus]|uniref:Mammalian ependymin-related protein 1 n=1 Tax=Pantherophis guttatus TaxID=94885 RepID=A0A6P9BBH3_PANGU|nr:mammalian ependymin-related protein 1 isoform X2 [Pantherophis guttatus]
MQAGNKSSLLFRCGCGLVQLRRCPTLKCSFMRSHRVPLDFIPNKLNSANRFFEYIYLYKDAVMYQIEQLTKLCSKISLSEPWDPYDIPDNSTYEDQYYIGGPSDQIMVQEWSDRKPARKFENWVGVYTVKDCYPVQETYTKNYSVTTSTRFFDLKLGISDPSVFSPPSTCQTAQSEKMTYVC